MLLFFYVRVGVCSGPVRVSPHDRVSCCPRVWGTLVSGYVSDRQGKGVRTLVERHCSFACASSRFALFVSFLSLIVGVGCSG